MRIKRRDFLKAGLAAGALAALDGPILNSLAFAQREKDSGAVAGSWIPSTCQGCTAWCPVEFFVQENRVVKVRGNQLSKANNGYVCPRAPDDPADIRP